MLTAKEVDSCPSSSGEMNHLLPGNFLGRHADALIGNAEIGGKTVEVKSASGFLDEGTPVVVVRVDEAQVTVKKK